jgi:hypothetical protein
LLDSFDDLIGDIPPCPGFVFHLHSLTGYDEPEILSCSINPICPKGADAGHSANSFGVKLAWLVCGPFSLLPIRHSPIRCLAPVMDSELWYRPEAGREEFPAGTETSKAPPPGNLPVHLQGAQHGNVEVVPTAG